MIMIFIKQLTKRIFLTMMLIIGMFIMMVIKMIKMIKMSRRTAITTTTTVTRISSQKKWTQLCCSRSSCRILYITVTNETVFFYISIRVITPQPDRVWLFSNIVLLLQFCYISMVSCQKGSSRHMADRALLAGYPRYKGKNINTWCSKKHDKCHFTEGY